MENKTAIIITSINAPNRAMQMFAEGAQAHAMNFYVIGDTKSPADFELEGCQYYSVDAQHATGLDFAKVCPTRHYARKNIGYLIAMQAGVDVIIDTDDDNLPREGFWSARVPEVEASVLRDGDWVNAYKYFSDALIWPRGLPLDQINKELPEYETLPVTITHCPIQQGLADENPDVDAIYRLLLPLPQNFRKDRKLVLSGQTWCPFNSQNTTWFREAFPLLYLPAYCSFRMTDIWRSFVAQRIARENGWNLLFHDSTVWQERNDHSLMKDFEDEVSGYLNNEAIRAALDALDLQPGVDALLPNLKLCYQCLIENKWVGAEEMELVDLWSKAF
jgi:glycosyltransferase involved in cell wall biosynthesis